MKKIVSSSQGLAQAHAARLSAPIQQRLRLHCGVHATKFALPVDAVVDAPGVALLPSVAHDLHQANHAQQKDQDTNRLTADLWPNSSE